MLRFFKCQDCGRWFDNEDDLKEIHVYEYEPELHNPQPWKLYHVRVCTECIQERTYDPVRGTSGIHPDQS
jgi:hypothetical protein